MFVIRRYIDADLDEVVALWYRSWMHTFPNLNHPQPLEQWKSRFQNDYVNHAEVWVADVSGQILGFVVVSGSEIAQIFVDINAQGNGVGTRLLNQAKQSCSGSLRLTTLEQNAQARQFYEKHGFVGGATGVNPINGHPNIEYHWSP
jgi:putative acetyltransferase